MNRKSIISIGLIICLLVSVFTATASALNLGNILKIGGIAFLVTQYGDEIDGVITKALGQREAAVKGATKVVPILSLGRGGYIGAAQVVGTPEHVKNVKAVFQVEARIGSFRAKVLIPTETNKPGEGGPTRAKGVGVSAVIEFKI